VRKGDDLTTFVNSESQEKSGALTYRNPKGHLGLSRDTFTFYQSETLIKTDIFFHSTPRPRELLYVKKKEIKHVTIIATTCTHRAQIYNTPSLYATGLH
jgi:hypothetical protein